MADLPCSACGTWIPADLAVCPECGADPDDDIMPCNCDNGTVLMSEGRGPAAVERPVTCTRCLGTREAPTMFYDQRQAARGD